MINFKSFPKKTLIFSLIIVPLLFFVFYTLTVRGTPANMFFEKLAEDAAEFTVAVKSDEFRVKPQMTNLDFRAKQISAFAECLRFSESVLISLGKSDDDKNIYLHFDSLAVKYEVKVFWRPSEETAYVMSYAGKKLKRSNDRERLESGNYGGVCLHNVLINILAPS